MAIPNKYIDKIKDKDSGESRPICPPAEHVSVDNENFEGETLDEVLGEVARSIEEAGQGGYAPPQGGIPKTDLAESVQVSLDAADSAVQPGELATVAKTGSYNDLKNKPVIPSTTSALINDAGFITENALTTAMGTKQDKISAGNGITIAQDGKTVSVDAEVVQPATADGTFTIRIGNNTYTINLNHSHPQYLTAQALKAGSNVSLSVNQQTGEVTINAAGGSGGTQVQADWNQTDSTAVDFIKNKPTAVSAFTNDAGYLTQQSLAGRVQSQDVVTIVKITQSAYDALQVKDSSTLYLITES